MAITYPLLIPDHSFRSMTMRMKRVVGVSESPFTLEQQVYEHQGARWEAEITLPPMNLDEARAWEAFFISLRGRKGTFLMGNPLHNAFVTGVALSGTAPARSTSISVTGGAGQTINAGEYFQIGTGLDSHIHQVVETITLDGSDVLTIEPPLRTSYNNDSLNFTQPKGVWRLSSNDVEWSIDSASIYGFTFACQEAL
jgi:hypothetical protein